MKKLTLIFIAFIIGIVYCFSQNNRTAYQTAVDNDITPIVTVAKLTTHLKDELAESVVFRTDVISSTVVATVDANTLDFSDYDQIVFDGATNDVEPTFTLSNIENGEIVSIKITKNANRGITFANATNITPNQSYIDVNSTSVTYLIIRKGSVNYALALVETIVAATTTNAGILEVATTAEAQAGTANDKIITPDNLQDVTATTSRKGVVELATTTEVRNGTAGSLAVIASDLNNAPAFSSLTLKAGSNYTGSLLYRKDNLGYVHIYGQITKGGTTSSETFADLPSGYQTTSLTAYICCPTNEYIGNEMKAVNIAIGTDLKLKDYAKLADGTIVYINLIFHTEQ